MRKIVFILCLIIISSILFSINAYADTDTEPSTSNTSSFPADEETDNAPQRETDSDLKSVKPTLDEVLPQVSSDEVIIPSAIGADIKADSSKPKIWAGISGWIMIIAGFVIILSVLFTFSAKPKNNKYNSLGKKSYTSARINYKSNKYK